MLKAGQGRWFFPSTQHWWGHIWTVLTFPAQDRHRTLEQVQQRFMKLIYDWSICLMRRAWELGLVSLEKVSFSEDLVNINTQWQREKMNGKAKWQDKRQIKVHVIPSEHKKTPFSCDNGQTLKQVAWESPYVEICKTWLNVVMGNLFQLTLTE